ncbi:hypothetical protein BaRGS_00009563 [Batillaria attramentaria]|uniref:PiggyBac transposable element-derived protein domain-containing protein n=1 Tax=Batillaria attramentaria TaxID=370345 RepID=A0ABD0LJH2_9CAEN
MYIPSKPTRYGIKLYCVCDASNGYVCKMQVYTGAGPDGREKDHGPNVIKRLSQDFLGKGHTIYMDSFFSSPALFHHLHERDTMAVGTVRSGREGLPEELHPKVKKLKKGESLFRRKDDLLCVRYRDKKDVFLLSTKHTTEEVNLGRDRQGNDKVKLKVVHDYNNKMKGVDQFDQHLSYYTFYRRTAKWWKRTAFHLMHLAKVQAYLLYKTNDPEGKLAQYEFTIRLVEQLTEEVPRLKAPSRQVPMPAERLSGKGVAHYPTRIPGSTEKKSAQRVCACCSFRDPNNDKQKPYLHCKYTTFECKRCGVGLCVDPCFTIYHEYQDVKPKVKEVLGLDF